MPTVQKITPFLWLDTEAEEAAEFYTGIFPDSKIVSVSRFGEEGQEIHGKPPGSVMTVVFELAGQTFIALNGGPMFKLTEAVSFQIGCDTAEEIDHYWEKLTEGGDTAAQQCGWLKDKFGLSWQVVPSALPRLLGDPDPAKSRRVMKALLQMKKLDLDELERAHRGDGEG